MDSANKLKLQSRLASLKERVNQSSQSESQTSNPFPLSAFIKLYCKAHSKDVYIEYFAGTKLLYDWLYPFYNDMPWEVKPLPPLVSNYELQKLAEILHIHPSIIFQEVLSWNK